MTGRWAAVLRAQITHLCAYQDWRSLAPANVQNGGSRATAMTSDRHTARLMFQRVSEPSADYARLLRVLPGENSACRSA